MPTPHQPLAARSCVPCRGGVPPLDPGAVDAYQAEVPDWSVRDNGHRIERVFKFRTFADAFALVRQVAALAEAEGHHPDIAFGWGYARISLHTHAIGGLHENDFILAAKIDRLAASGEERGE